jgi:glycosyltransferase involved in cell wall biosynthesis
MASHRFKTRSRGGGGRSLTYPLISVVVPVHNGGRLLAECIESICVQSYSAWTLRVFDNASTDDTPDIVASLAADDERISLHRTEVLTGLDANHSRAFRCADPGAAFIKAVQADDRLFPRCLEAMVGLARAAPTVGIISAYRVSGDSIDLRGLPPRTTVVPGRAILRQSLLGGPYVTGSPTSLLLRSDLVRQRDPFYDPDFEHADTEAAYWMMTKTDFGLVHAVLTYTRRQPGSRTSWTGRVDSYSIENIRMLLRYGPDVLERTEYRRRLRFELRRLVSFHVRQRTRPSRRNDREFSDYQRQAIVQLARAAAGDRDVMKAVWVIERLLRTSTGTSAGSAREN